MPASGNRAKQRSENAGEGAARQKHVQVFLDIGAARFDAPEGFVDRREHEDVHARDGEQEGRGHQCARHAADGFDVLDLVLERRSAQSDCDCPAPHDGRMPERKEKANRGGPLALLHELSGDVVDGGDMVGVDGVAQSKGVGQKGGSELDREIPKRDESPAPGCNVSDSKDRIEDNNRPACALRVVAQPSYYNAFLVNI